jgi:hypothetical protein
VGGVPIALRDAGQDFEKEIDAPILTEGIPIVGAEALVLLKLHAWRRRDQEDVIQLLRRGLDDRPIRKYIAEVDPDMVARFERLLAAADEED